MLGNRMRCFALLAGGVVTCFVLVSSLPGAEPLPSATDEEKCGLSIRKTQSGVGIKPIVERTQTTWAWVSDTAVEYLNPYPYTTDPVIRAVSNLAFTATTPSYPSFVFLVQPDPAPYSQRDLYLAIYDGANWNQVLLDTSTTNDPLHFDAIDDGNGDNISIAFEFDGSLGIAIPKGNWSSDILYLIATPGCGCPCLGDINGDGLLNGLDIQGFVDCILSGGQNCDCADIDQDGDVDETDMELFIQLLLNGAQCPPPGPCSDWSNATVTREVAAPGRSYTDFGFKTLHMSPDGVPWIMFGEARPDPQTTQPGLAWRWGGVWDSIIGSDIPGYDQAMSNHDLYVDHTSSFSLGAFRLDAGEYLPTIAFSAFGNVGGGCPKTAVGTMVIEPGLSVSSYDLIEMWSGCNTCQSRTGPLFMSQGGAVVHSHTIGTYVGPSIPCLWDIQVIAPDGTVIDDAELYRESVQQIVDHTQWGPAFVYAEVDGDGQLTGTTKAHWGYGDQVVRTPNPSAVGYDWPRNLSITEGPSTAIPAYSDKPVVILFHIFEEFDPVNGFIMHYVIEVITPVGSSPVSPINNTGQQRAAPNWSLRRLP